jgi:hypothetical protein
MLKQPILYIIFNRLDYVKESFEALHAYKPNVLYIAGDGPRPNKLGEKKLVDSIRKYVIDNIDWECEVKTRFQDENKGCTLNVSEAVTWFFSQEKEGIILEDDIVPNQCFFRFCDEMLNKYREQKEIFSVTGYKSPHDFYYGKDDYFFQRSCFTCWGWATWADRWNKNYVHDLSKYDISELDYIKYNDGKLHKFLSYLFVNANNKEIDVSWDYKTLIAVVCKKLFQIVPSVNLVSNVGIVGAHYNCKSDECLQTRTYSLYSDGSLHHPIMVKDVSDSKYFIKKGEIDNLRSNLNDNPAIRKIVIDNIKLYKKYKIRVIVYKLLQFLSLGLVRGINKKNRRCRTMLNSIIQY